MNQRDNKQARVDSPSITATGLPIVAIIGRANVGKSTLFNRLVGQRLAIVEDEPGTTRDRIYAEASWNGRRFTLVDTGGLEVRPTTPMAENIREQVRAALEEADAILFVCDVRDGLTPGDWDIAENLRGATVPVVMIANKADDVKFNSVAAEFNRLGLGEPMPVSGYHGRNVPELLDRLAAVLPPAGTSGEATDVIGLSIVGRPNVGKSMLLNALLGEERSIVSEIAGTTRDSIDTLFRHGDRSFLIIDTAGVRRRGQVRPGIEHYAVLRTLKAISRSDVSLLVIDGSEGVTAQDMHVAGYIRDVYKGMIIVINKWDLVPDSKKEEVSEQAREKLRFVPYAPIMYTSALLKEGINMLLPQVERVWRERQTRVAPQDLSEFLKETTKRHVPPRAGTRQLKIYSMEQAAVNPPTFVVIANDPDIIHFSYRRYLENSLRDAYGYFGSPIRLFFRRKGAKRSGLAVGGEGK